MMMKLMEQLLSLIFLLVKLFLSMRGWSHILTWLKPRAPVLQFFTNSNGSVGMNGDEFAEAADTDGVNPGANILVGISVIGTATVKRENKMKTIRRHK